MPEHCDTSGTEVGSPWTAGFNGTKPLRTWMTSSRSAWKLPDLCSSSLQFLRMKRLGKENLKGLPPVLLVLPRIPKPQSWQLRMKLQAWLWQNCYETHATFGKLIQWVWRFSSSSLGYIPWKVVAMSHPLREVVMILYQMDWELKPTILLLNNVKGLVFQNCSWTNSQAPFPKRWWNLSQNITKLMHFWKNNKSTYSVCFVVLIHASIPASRTCLLKRAGKLQEGLDRFNACDVLTDLQNKSFGWAMLNQET